jgi:hypothetical protein
MATKHLMVVIAVAGCKLGPLVSDETLDAAPAPDAAAPGSDHILPPGTAVPSISTNAELINQIRINDGLNDTTLINNGGVVVRGTGKSAGAVVRFWNFGPALIESTIAVVAPLYVFGTVDGAGVFTPLPDHPPLIDTICGDVRYSAMRRVINVPVTDHYAGERITSLAALSDAIELGLVGDPVPDGTWVNMPVVLPDTKLEVGDPLVTPPASTRQVYGRGYLVDVFELGTSLGRQPLRFGSVPVGQASGLQTGVATGTPPILSTAIDPQSVFQYAIPTAPPAGVFSYSPLSADVVVRLATGVTPSMIVSDTDLFKRSSNGAITGYNVNNVASYVIMTTVNNVQLQFAEGSP